MQKYGHLKPSCPINKYVKEVKVKSQPLSVHHRALEFILIFLSPATLKGRIDNLASCSN
jgi:hypothetical protein